MPMRPSPNVGVFKTGALGSVCGTAGPSVISVAVALVATAVFVNTRNEYSFPFTSGTPSWLLIVTEVAVDISVSASHVAPPSAVDSIM